MKLDKLQAEKPFKAYLYIKDAQVRTGKNGNQFIKLQLSDPDFREVTGFLWNVSKEDVSKFTQGSVVAVMGKGKSFNESLQLDIQQIRLTDERDKIDIADFIESAPEDPEEMFKEIKETIKAFKNEEIKTVVDEAFGSRKEELVYFPAAKSVHHAMRSGLLYHTVSMLRIGKALSQIYPQVNTDLLYAGIILHDLGKIDEMDATREGGVIDYTNRGKLLGHITSQISELQQIGTDYQISEEVMNLLEHMILSHHYQPEYGSPVKPMFLEAELLHHIDMIDARVNSFDKIQRNLQPGTFSERLPLLDNIRIYRPKI